jgi:hypothetical protein
MADDEVRSKEEAKGREAGLTTLLAGWLLVHELADDWIRDAVARGKQSQADPVAQLAAEVDVEKERLREALSAEISSTEPPGQLAELKESLEALGRRLTSIEAQLDGLAERGRSPG